MVTDANEAVHGTNGSKEPENEQPTDFAGLLIHGKHVEYLSKWEYTAAQAAIDIERADCGCNTPLEQFTSRLIRDCARGYQNTPEDVEDLLAEFKRDFESMASESAEFVQKYPAAVSAALPKGFSLEGKEETGGGE